MTAPHDHDDLLGAVDPAALATLPVFPLPDCVLLPGGLLPLHVFEPRYRELTRDCLAGNHLMGVARLRPGYEADYYRRPKIYDHVGLGRIICSDEMADGRYLIVLRGVARVAIEEELPATTPYRTVRARMLENAACDPARARAGRDRLIALCDQLADHLPSGGAELRELVRSEVDPGRCADAVAAALVMEADARQRLLEALCPEGRLAMTVEHIGKLLCSMAPCSATMN